LEDEVQQLLRRCEQVENERDSGKEELRREKGMHVEAIF
tara:strand:- start:238 stop:354 length:117 start_codon:yes stop_codon:yes gene_type:complete